MSSIAQNQELLKNLFELLEAQRLIFKQKGVYLSVVTLQLGEILTFARHTMIPALVSLDLTDQV